ncbi:MAG: acyl carrier protein [Bacteroidia bacterium]
MITVTIKNSTTAIETKVKRLIVDTFGVEEGIVKPEASFNRDLGADSLDMLALMTYCEKEFNITIPDTQVKKITTVSEVITYITLKTAVA